MSNSHRGLKATLFKIFAANFEFVNAHNGQFRFVPEIPDAYMCPICFEAFLEKDLTPSSGLYLTLEHVPPDSLGGKGTILTCNKCNSTSGKKLDKQLLTYLGQLDFINFLPNVKQNPSMTFNGHQINTRIRVSNEGQIDLHLDTQRSNPSVIKQVIEEIDKASANGPNHKVGVSGQIPLPKIETKLVEIALLRIAYLIAISRFGYSVLVNYGIQYVREQIVQQDQEILKHPFRIELPGIEPGVYIIKEPEELQCFLVVFDLTTKSRSHRFSVILPGPSGPGVNVYDAFKDRINRSQTEEYIPMMLEQLPFQKCVGKESLAFAFHFYWQKHTGKSL